MRRLLAAILLAVLPLQLCWSAVATYCGHEKRVGVSHFGHHEHQHRAAIDGAADTLPADAEVADAAAEKPLGVADSDCGQCHGGCNAVAAWPGVLAAAHSKVLLCAPADEFGRVRARSRPERPKWLSLA